MAATAAVNGPPLAHHGPNGENLQSHSGVPNPMQQDPGMYSTGQEPGSSTRPQHPLFARPVFPVHAPPPPPFLHYQWPLPFSYNPFAGFPGMGYGMVMSPFPPPYMDTPAYILPHPRVLPVDYRRMLHPQAPRAVPPQQIPHPTQRFSAPHTLIRQTVSSGVQTDFPQRGLGRYDEGCPLFSSDSGTGTASVSPSSSHSPGVEKDTLPHSNPKESGTCTTSLEKDDLKILHYSGMTTVQSWVRATRETHKRAEDPVGQEPPMVPPCRNGHRMSSSSSPDDMVPLCSSSQREDEAARERRASVPDILMSSGAGTPLALALLQSLNASKQLVEQEDGIEANSHEETTEIILNMMSLNSSQRRKTLNESVWSVESIAPYFPNKDWLMQNGIFEPDVFDMTQEVENGGLSTKNHNLIVQEGKERRLSRVFSPPEFIVTSESGVIFSTPGNEQNPPKKQEVRCEAEVPEMRVQDEDQRITVPEKCALDPTPLQNKTLSTLTEEDLDDKSSEPEANQSPKHKCENKQQEEQHPSSPTKGDDVLLNSAEEKSSSPDQLILQCEADTGVACQVTSEELCVPMADLKLEDVSPSKRHLVHSSVQCELGCLCSLRDNLESNERKNCQPQAVRSMNQQRYPKKNQWKNRSQERFNSQQEAPGRPAKSKGGPRRNMPFEH